MAYFKESNAVTLSTRGAKSRSALMACGTLLSLALAFGCAPKEQSKQEAQADTSTVDTSKAVPAPAPQQDNSSARDFKPSPVKYDKRTLRSDYMAAPANALAIGRIGANKGKLILACGALNRIIIMDPDTGRVIREYGSEYGVEGLDDVSEAPDGTLYFSNIPIGKIGWIKPDGSHGHIDAKPWINSIAVTRDSKWLYWGTCIGDDELWRYPLGEDGLPSGPAELIQQNPGWSNSMDPSSDGHIYAPLNMYGDIRRINPETGEIKTVYSDLEFPSACDIDDSTGLLYSTEFHLGYITRIDLKEKDPSKAKRILAVVPPATDNIAVTDVVNKQGGRARVFGSSFIEDWIFEAYENGDPPRTIAKGGMLPTSVQILKGESGERIFTKDLGGFQQYYPAENRTERVAQGNFWNYAQDKQFDRGHVRYDPKRIDWTKTGDYFLTIPWGKIMQPTSDGELLVGGNMMENEGNRLAIADSVTGDVSRTITDLEYVQDAIKVGDDIYYAGGESKNWPKATSIIRIKPDDSQEVVLTGKNFKAFARNDEVAFVSDDDTGQVLQVVKDGKWLDSPVEIASGLIGPQGMTISKDGNLIVMEKNSDPYNGRMLSIDLQSGEITVLASALMVDPSINSRDWNVLFPISVVAQSSDGAIYFTEPGSSSFSVLWPEG